MSLSLGLEIGFDDDNYIRVVDKLFGYLHNFMFASPRSL